MVDVEEIKEMLTSSKGRNPKLSVEEIDLITDMFDYLDGDRDGYIDATKARKLYGFLGYPNPPGSFLGKKIDLQYILNGIELKRMQLMPAYFPVSLDAKARHAYRMMDHKNREGQVLSTEFARFWAYTEKVNSEETWDRVSTVIETELEKGSNTTDSDEKNFRSNSFHKEYEPVILFEDDEGFEEQLKEEEERRLMMEPTLVVLEDDFIDFICDRFETMKSEADTMTEFLENERKKQESEIENLAGRDSELKYDVNKNIEMAQSLMKDDNDDDDIGTKGLAFVDSMMDDKDVAAFGFESI